MALLLPPLFPKTSEDPLDNQAVDFLNNAFACPNKLLFTICRLPGDHKHLVLYYDKSVKERDLCRDYILKPIMKTL